MRLDLLVLSESALSNGVQLCLVQLPGWGRLLDQPVEAVEGDLDVTHDLDATGLAVGRLDIYAHRRLAGWSLAGAHDQEGVALSNPSAERLILGIEESHRERVSVRE